MRKSFFWGLGVVALLLGPQTWAEPVDFTLRDLQGQPHNLSDYRGRWVLVNYWATWCPPCLEEIPELEVFHNNHQDTDALVLGVNAEQIGSEALREFVDAQFVSYPILRGKPGSRSELGAITGLPTSFLVTPTGEVVARQVGAITAQAIEDFIENYPNRSTRETR